MEPGMRTLAFVLALSAAPIGALAQPPAVPDGAIIESAEVSGIGFDDLSPGLRQDIAALAGQPLDRSRLTALAARIEGERPDVVAAVREVAVADSRARIIFLVARISDHADLVENINARYVVEGVDIRGIPDTSISRELFAEIQAITGAPLDSEEADRLRRRLQDELPDYDVSRRMSRGIAPGHVRLVFELTRSERSRWLRFSPSRSKVVYHENHGWSGVVDVDFGGRTNNQLTVGFVLGNDDDLIGEYSGYRFRFENRKAGTERLGVSFEVSRLSQDWREATLSALAATPDASQAYRRRITVEPKVAVALTRNLWVNAGVSTSELTPLESGRSPEQSNAFLAGVGYNRTWRRDDVDRRQDVEASYELRAGADSLASDLDYRRHFGGARYRVEGEDTTFIAEVRAGRISGRAPLFERFSLGDSSTLRGWNKYDLAPAGAARMWHQSVEIRFHGFAYFLDAGSVWDEAVAHKVRLGTGIGFHTDRSFLTVAFPLNADDVNATFMLGVRF
jgi:hypothetical protein